MLAGMKKQPAKLSAREVFARNLRRARRMRETTQEGLSLEAGVSRPYVGSLERGATNVSIDNMGRLADALRVPLRDLVDPDKFTDLDEA
jgi:transcriptional regulator with XRE-family HTH domain